MDELRDMTSNRRRLTDRTIRALKVDPERYVDYPDELTPGLVLRVTPNGAKTFGYRFRWGGKTTRLSLGVYAENPEQRERGRISLEQARELAGKAKSLLKHGEHPKTMFEPEEPEDVSEVLTFSAAVERWAKDRKAKGRRSIDHMKRVLELHAVPTLGGRPIAEITRSEIVRLLEELRDRGFTGQVNRVHVIMSGVFRWALNAGEIEAHPITGLEPLVAEKGRGTVLSLDQLAEIWRAADRINRMSTPIVKMLILTAQRREEVARMSWEEVEVHAALWTIPAERHKGKRNHRVPLSPEAMEIIGAQNPRIRGSFIFSLWNGAKPFNGWRHALPDLKEEAALLDGKGQPLDWHLHDIRRAVATALGENLNVSEEMVGRVLGHSGKSRMGITATYDRSERLDQMRSVLDDWGKLISEYVAQDTPKVVALKGSKSLL
jgi:integrase